MFPRLSRGLRCLRPLRASVEVQSLEARALLSQVVVPAAAPGETARPTAEIQHVHAAVKHHGRPKPVPNTVLWDTLTPNPAIAVTSQNNQAVPSQAADDFFFSSATASAFSLRTIKLDGLFTNKTARITDVNVQLYQSYPFDSNAAAATPVVRANGPSDNQFATFDGKARSLMFHQHKMGRFTTQQTITPGSASAEGAVGPGVTGQLRQIDVTLRKPVTLYPTPNPGPGQINHYWLAVTVNTSKGSFYWVAGASPTSPTERQTWLHTNPFDPNWHRLSDIINGNNTNMNGSLRPAYNESFQLVGKVIS